MGSTDDDRGTAPELEAKPMHPAAHGGCVHPHRTITADGVWVRVGGIGGQFSSAHRDCYERWAAARRLDPFEGTQ